MTNQFSDHTYTLSDLLDIECPAAPSGFQSFWQDNYNQIRNLKPKITLRNTHKIIGNWQVTDIYYESTDDQLIGGWLLVPKDKPPKRGFIVGHGYGGRHGPDTHLPFEDSAILFPCCRGISRSLSPPISSDPRWHVLHDIDKIDRYIIRGCVEDTWLAVTCLESIFPHLSGKLGYLGISFSGGIGALALPYEKRLARGHLNVPTFGHHRLRLRIDTLGSGKYVKEFFNKYPRTALKTLRYYDAANAAEKIDIPMHCALALKDDYVCPPGQFAIYNAIPCEKKLFIYDEGHSDYENKQNQENALIHELNDFFEPLY